MGEADRSAFARSAGNRPASSTDQHQLHQRCERKPGRSVRRSRRARRDAESCVAEPSSGATTRGGTRFATENCMAGSDTSGAYRGAAAGTGAWGRRLVWTRRDQRSARNYHHSATGAWQLSSSRCVQQGGAPSSFALPTTTPAPPARAQFAARPGPGRLRPPANLRPSLRLPPAAPAAALPACQCPRLRTAPVPSARPRAQHAASEEA